MASESREPTPTVKRAAVQAAVLGATEELLAEGSSFADLGIERIATRAGISRTAFYFYFKDKKELLARLTEDISAQLYEQADVWFSGGADPRQEVHDALARIGGVYRDHGPLLRAIVEASTYEPEIAVFWRRLLSRFVDAAVGRMTEEEGDAVSPERLRARAFSLVWMTERTFYEQLVQDVPFSVEDVVDALTDIWMRAVYRAA